MADERRESRAGYHYYSSYRDCPRHFYLAYLLGLKPRLTGPALIKGGAMHEAFAAYWLGVQHGYHNIDEICFETFKNEMRSRMFEYEEHNRFEQDLESGLGMLRKWIDTWGEYDKEHYKVIGVEKTYEVNFGPPGQEMLFTVRLDRIYQDKQTGVVYAVESKTTGWSLIKMFENTARGDQITAQIWALSKMEPDWNCNSAIIDVLYNRGKVFQCDRPGPSVYRTADALRVFEMGMYATIVEITQKVKALREGTPWPLLFPPHRNYCRLFGCEYEPLCDTNVQAGERPPGFRCDDWVSEESKQQLAKAQGWDLKNWSLT